MIMLVNYYIVKTCLRYSGLDEEIENQLKEMDEKKEEYITIQLFIKKKYKQQIFIKPK